MGQLKVILGKAHTGKSSYLIKCLEQHMARGEHAVLIVPEQSTYYYEQRLCDRTGGLIGVEVYGFERLCQRLIEHGNSSLPTLSDQGRYMVLRRAAHRQRNDLQLFARASQLKGFAASMDTHIGRFKQSCITPSALLSAADKLPDSSLLRQKIRDLSLLYQESESFLQQQYLTSNDLMTVAASLISSSFLRGCYIYIDELDHVTEQIYRLLLQILLTARSVTVTLRWSDDPLLQDLFAPDRQVYERLFSMCAKNGIPFSEELFLTPSRTCDPALNHLENNLFSNTPSVFPDYTDAVQILAAKDRVTEAELIGDQILEAVRFGKRFSDFTIIASDLAAYGPILKRAFTLRGIPLFYDTARPMSGLSSTDFVISLARAACLGFPMSDVLRILKSGYAGIPAAEVELFENYVLKYGIYGSELKNPFTIGEIPLEAEKVRSELMELLMPLTRTVDSKKTSDKVRALWSCLSLSGLREQLEQEAASLLQDGFVSEAQLVAQLWDTLKELFLQMDTVLGDTEITQKEFPMLLEEGLSGTKIGILPERRDAVVLGDLMRTRIAPVDTLFVMGCNEGVFPPLRSDDDLINDDELETLRSLGLPVWESTQEASALDRLTIHSMIGKARSRIVFSYPFSSGNTDLSRSPLLTSVQELFPKNKEIIGMSRISHFPMSKTVAFSTLASLIAEWKQNGLRENGDDHKELASLLSYFESDPEYQERVKALLEGSASMNSPMPLKKEVSRALYGYNPSMSASRLEQFARCPFAQYLKYGLGAEERKISEEKASDSGTFLHDCLDAFVKAVEAGSLEWSSITDEEIDQILDAILPQILASHNDGIFSRDARLRESAFLRIRAVRLSARSIARQLKAGRFEVAKTEMSFGMDDVFAPVWLTLSDGTKVRIYGKIDRVDQTPDQKLIRIIDYKMGKNRKFDPSHLLSGESLQLPLYFLAAKQLGGECAGMYYMPLTLDTATEDKEPSHLLYGITVSEDDVLNATEKFSGKSDLIHDLKRTATGSVSGSVTTRSRFDEILRMAEQISAKQAEGILNGHAEIIPTESGCTWCNYRSVCRFDKKTGSKTRFVKKIAIKDFLLGKEDCDEIQ